MTMPSSLQNFWDDQTSIIEALYQKGEISLAQSAQNIFTKSLFLIAASFLEAELRDLVVRVIQARSKNDICILSFCQKKGIERQYHTWFDWDKQNVNAFFSLFGDDVKKNSGDKIKNEIAIEKAAKDFLFVGRTRNELIHQNLLVYPLAETAAQARERIESAVDFVKFVEAILMPNLA